MAGNPNLTGAQLLPGVFGYVDYNANGGNQLANNRTLLWGYQTSAAQKPPNMPLLPASQQDANNWFGAGSDIARMYASAVSQPESVGSTIYCIGLAEPSGGVASTYKLKVYVSNTNPSKAGTMALWVDSQPVPGVGYSTTDTANTIASALATALQSMIGVSPIASAIASGAVVTVTYIHKGTTGEDLPFRCLMAPDGSGVQLSPGQAAFTTNATGAGSTVVYFGSQSVSTSLAGGETPAQVATKVAASFAANTYALTATVDGSINSQVNFFFNNNWDVRRMSAAVITSTGLTVNLSSGATDGTGSASSLTYNGAQGTGAPSLTQPITNLTNSKLAYRAWAWPWLDTSSLNTMMTYVEAASNGSITGQKYQVVTMMDFQSLATDGAIPAATSPTMTSTAPHYALCWSPDVPVQGMEGAARIAAARAALWLEQPNKNWNAFQLSGNTAAPLLTPPQVPSLDQQNTALRTYGMAPVVVGNSGRLEIVKGRTTSLATDRRLWSWSAEAQATYHIVDATARLQAQFSGGSIVRYSTPKAPKLFDTNSFIDAVKNYLISWESQGNYDGAAVFGPAVTAVVDGNNPNKIDLDWPESPVLDLDQVSFAEHFS